MAAANLTVQRLREVLHYDPETGIFVWRKRLFSRRGIGDLAGINHHNGYINIGIDGRIYLAHRLAWLFITGKHPNEIDHINGRRNDNRLLNLRECDRRLNCENQRNATGATLDKRDGRWTSRIKVAGKTIVLGRFSTKEEATQTYLEAKRVLHKGCTV